MSAPRPVRHRRAAALAGVLVFLAGSNYCLVAGLAGVPMTCLGSAPKVAAGGHCAHASGGHCAERASADRPAAPDETLPPCCVVRVSTTAPTVSCPPADAAPLAIAVPGAVAIEVSGSEPAPAADESPPPLRFTPAPPSGRAPPLA